MRGWTKKLGVLAINLISGWLGLALLLSNTSRAAWVLPDEPSRMSEKSDEAGAADILEKHIAAMGGRPDTKRPRLVETEQEVEVFGSVRKIYRLEEEPRGRFYQRTEAPDGVSEQGFDGNRVWTKTAFQRGYLKDNDPVAKRLLARAPTLFDYKESGKKFYRLPNERIADKDHFVVRSQLPDALGRDVPVRYYIDAATLLLKRVVQGEEVTHTTDYDDYRNTNGRLRPFSTVTKTPQATAKAVVKKINVDAQADRALFEYREDGGKTSSSRRHGETTVSNEKPQPSPPGKKAEDKLPEALRIDTFNLVWDKVHSTYWDETFGGVDWQRVKQTYLPLAKTAETNEAYHRVLNQMVSELKRSHFRVVAPHQVASLSTEGKDLRNGTVGLNLRWAENQLLVVDVEKDSPAAAAGVRKGYVLNKLNGKTTGEILTEARRRGPGADRREELWSVRLAQAELTGTPNTAVALEFLDERDKRRPLDLRRQRTPVGPALKFEFKRLEPNFGYIAFRPFVGDLHARFQEAVHALNDTAGLVVDLRGNTGGVGELATAISGLLCAEDGSLGTARYRYRVQSYAYRGTGPEAYRGNVVFLVDEWSGSAAEVMAGGLRDGGRAVVVGNTTAGTVLPSVVQPLPTGGALQHVISSYETPKGVVLEGRGVTPDRFVTPSRKALLNNLDPMLDAALDLLRTMRTRIPI